MVDSVDEKDGKQDDKEPTEAERPKQLYVAQGPEFFAKIGKILDAKEPCLTYAQCQEALSAAGFDLNAAVRSEVREKIRWGWKWVVDENALTKSYMSQPALQEVTQAIREGRRFQVLFSPKTNPYSAPLKHVLKILFSKCADDFGFLQDHMHFQHDETLLKKFSDRGESGLKENAAIVFTPADIKVLPEMMGKSPDEWFTLRETEKGIQRVGVFLEPDRELLRPTEWIEFSLRSIDNGLRTLYPDQPIDQMDPTTCRKFRRDVIRTDRRIDAYFPDTRTTTLFPHWHSGEEVVPQGPALGLKWEIENGKARIAVLSCERDKILADAGPRRAFGRMEPSVGASM